jgi:hypothetical protein
MKGPASTSRKRTAPVSDRGGADASEAVGGEPLLPKRERRFRYAGRKPDRFEVRSFVAVVAEGLCGGAAAATESDRVAYVVAVALGVKAQRA